MPVTGTSTNYSGRLQDMYISGPLNFSANGFQNVTYSFGKVTQFIAGSQKLIQRFLISLVNSGLMEDLVGSPASNIQYAKTLFNQYKGVVVQNFRAYQKANPGFPLDEQLNTVQLLSVTSTGTTLNFSANLITQAGTSVTILLPLPLL